MPFFSHIFPKEKTIDMCTPYKHENMPQEVELSLHDSTMVESAEDVLGGLRINFKGGGFFQVTQSGKKQMELELQDTGTAAFVRLEGEVVMEMGKGKGHQRVKTELGSGTVIKQKIS